MDLCKPGVHHPPARGELFCYTGLESALDRAVEKSTPDHLADHFCLNFRTVLSSAEHELSAPTERASIFATLMKNKILPANLSRQDDHPHSFEEVLAALAVLYRNNYLRSYPFCRVLLHCIGHPAFECRFRLLCLRMLTSSCISLIPLYTPCQNRSLPLTDGDIEAILQAKAAMSADEFFDVESSERRKGQSKTCNDLLMVFRRNAQVEWIQSLRLIQIYEQTALGLGLYERLLHIREAVRGIAGQPDQPFHHAGTWTS